MKVNAKDLMIGDLFRVNKDVSFKKGTIVVIRGIDADRTFQELKGCVTCVAVDDPDKMPSGVWLEYLEPIPLTEEMLETNGFYLERNVGYIYEDDEYEVIVDLFNWKYRILYNRDVVMNKENFGKIAVHELQHAMLFAGLDKEFKMQG